MTALRRNSQRAAGQDGGQRNCGSNAKREVAEREKSQEEEEEEEKEVEEEEEEEEERTTNTFNPPRFQPPLMASSAVERMRLEALGVYNPGNVCASAIHR